MESKDSFYQVSPKMEEIIISINVSLMRTSFLIGGLLCYFHWEAMLISHVAMRVTKMPFNNMHELLDSDYNFNTAPGTSFWDAFKYGNTLWQRIYKVKLEPFEEEYKITKDDIKEQQMEWLLMNEKNALYYEYMSLS